jgi:drug/metabolite transporter (DMT)-like permease
VVFLKATATRDRASRILFIVNVTASVMVLATGVWFWESLTIEVILLVAAMAPIAIFGQICNIRAFRLTSAINLVPLRYSGIVFAAIFGILFFMNGRVLWRSLVQP